MIYFDNSATTKPCEESIKALNEALTDNWGNPSSAHFVGNNAHRMMEEANRVIAKSLGIRRPNDGKIIFTSGGTEANNLAIRGVVYAKERTVKNGRRGTVIITDGEHSSVEVTASSLEKDGFSVFRIPTKNGVLDIDYLEKNMPSDVIMASLMLVNNETGAIYDVKKASAVIKAKCPNAVIHTDCVQAYMKMKFTPSELGADLVSVSAHKIFSVKGAGALYVSPAVIKAKNISPVLFGGGQENGYRSGTEGVPSIVAFAAAASKGMAELNDRINAVTELSRYAIEKISEIDGVRLNIPEKRIPNILNMTVFNIKSETLLNYLSGKEICVSKSSACSTHSRNLSLALIAFGLEEADVDSSLRLSFSHFNTKEEVDIFCEALKSGISVLAKIRK